MIMDSLILRTATRLLIALMLVFAAFILWRGHNEPGGGFIAGLIAAVAFSLQALAFGVAAMRRLLIVDPRAVIGAGLVIAVVSGLFALFKDGGPLPFMTGAWFVTYDAAGNKTFAIGTPVLFDLGVFLVVVGAVVAMVVALMEED